MNKFEIEIRWAILYSILAIVWMILEKELGWHDRLIAKQASYTNLFGFVTLTIYTLALYDKKMKFYGGKMDWKQGFLSGIVFSLAISILSPIVQYAIHTYISPNYFDAIIAYVVSNKIQTQEQAAAYFNLKSYIMQSAFGGLSMGVILAAIVALFLKTKNK